MIVAGSGALALQVLKPVSLTGATNSISIPAAND